MGGLCRLLKVWFDSFRAVPQVHALLFDVNLGSVDGRVAHPSRFCLGEGGVEPGCPGDAIFETWESLTVESKWLGGAFCLSSQRSLTRVTKLT